ELCTMCANDLYLIDEVLDEFEDIADLEQVDRTELFRILRIRYLGAPVAAVPHIRRLAAAGQFDLSPHPQFFDASLLPDERRLLPSLTVLAGSPPGYSFLHSAAAEVVFHAICYGDGIAEEEGLVEAAAHDLIALLDAAASTCRTALHYELWCSDL